MYAFCSSSSVIETRKYRYHNFVYSVHVHYNSRWTPQTVGNTGTTISFTSYIYIMLVDGLPRQQEIQVPQFRDFIHVYSVVHGHPRQCTKYRYHNFVTSYMYILLYMYILDSERNIGTTISRLRTCIFCCIWTPLESV